MFSRVAAALGKVLESQDLARKTTWILIIMLISSLSFALGYLANREGQTIPIIIEKCST